MSVQLPLFDPPAVRLRSPFEVILGKNGQEFSADERRQRWDRWLEIAGKSPASRDLVEVWTDTDACEDCRHLDGYWCRLQELPATVNPILSFRHGMVGMACMGAGYEAIQ